MQQQQQQQHQQQQHNDPLIARPTQRLGNQIIEADGDTWHETLAVCEAPPSSNTPGKLILRSYYQNQSGKRVWDEPPSGATNIVPASDEMRRMADMQLSELHVVTTQSAVANKAAQTQQEEQQQKKRGFRLRWKKKEKPAPKPQQDLKIRYKPGSNMLTHKAGATTTTTTTTTGNSEIDDANLQEAIARSLAESEGVPYQPPKKTPERKVKHKSKSSPRRQQPAATATEDDQLAMAKALSLSAAHESGETEEQLLARVLEESRLEEAMNRGAQEATSAAAAPSSDEDLLGLYQDSVITSGGDAAAVWEEDRKPAARNSFVPASNMKSPPPKISMPNPYAAASTHPPATASGGPLAADFDPYSKTAPLKAPPPAATSKSPANPPGSLQKMTAKPAPSSARLNFGKRGSSTKKIQDQAGLV